jgi:hypothetical protein
MLVSLILVLTLCLAGYAAVRTTKESGRNSAGGRVDSDSGQIADGPYVVTPFESVSMNQTEVWRDNRHRAYCGENLVNIDGFLLFDVSGIPDTETIVSMTLRCYLEDDFGSPYNSPLVDVYYSSVDEWERATVPAGVLSLDTLLVNHVMFSSYVPHYDFVLNVAAHDWSVDLLDDQICLGFRDDAGYDSYVYFFGAYGDPDGPPPELTIQTASPVEMSSWASIKVLYR